MNRNPSTPVDGVSRRSVLAAGAAGLALSTSGCIDRVRSVVDDGGAKQFSLSILTVPADGDRENVQIATHLQENLEAVGIDVSVEMRSRSEFLETVLIEHDFDVYVGRHPADYDPDFLYEALHSAYANANEDGWQNPFRFSDPRVDDLLENQRRIDGKERKQVVTDLLEAIARRQPFVPICVPDEIRVARSDRFDGWEDGHLATRSGYLGLDPQEDAEQLHALVTDSRMSRNVNPLSATLRERGTTIDLLYDSLLTEREGELIPWLAEDVEWIEVEDGSATASVTLREDCFFHDPNGDSEDADDPAWEDEREEVTATDVKFTYEFLADTSLGLADVPSPAPRYRSHASAIDRVEIDGPHQLTITTSTGTEVGERALTAPILPEHRWRDQVIDRADGDDFEAPQAEWGLVTMNNIPPTGSGPYRYADHENREHLTLERFDDHFTRRADVDLPEPTVEEIRFTVDPGSKSSVERVLSGGADVTATMLGASSIANIPDEPGVTRIESPSRMFYHVGFNAQRSPFGNPNVRRAIARLIDKQYLVDTVFDGYASPLATPVTGEWVPDDHSLAWTDEDDVDPVVPFVGSEGELDVEAARDRFLEVTGYRYDDAGRLLKQY
ncbi:ABC transporter substrate-binding protein [Halosolutus amylolyticus]|uniref:ABC transporter substrate-binding protein n=1 Tax=Halosolutus amylolyticus TaxID=2932267 RepID=A0ABD5PV05_9EURY|nr:ABC transporter substrate-binding protein [Halosolutus amylolyticus]